MPTNINIRNRNKYLAWQDEAERIILFADIMGFKDRIRTTDFHELKEGLTSFRTAWGQKMKPLSVGNQLKFAVFSDSILVVADGVSRLMFNLVTKSAICLMQEALKQNFPLKGVISKGKFCFDDKNELYFGQPLVDAYLLQDEIKYYGIVVHHSAEKIVKDYLKKGTHAYSKTLIPLEKGCAQHYQLNWHLFNNLLNEEDNTDFYEKKLDEIEELVSGKPRMYVFQTRKMIESNTLDTKNSIKDGIISNEAIQ